MIGSQTEYNFSKARFEKTGIWILKARSENWLVENACFGLKKRRELNNADAWKLRAKERTGAREGDTRGVRSPLACLLLARPFILGKPGSTPPRKIPNIPPQVYLVNLRSLGAVVEGYLAWESSLFVLK